MESGDRQGGVLDMKGGFITGDEMLAIPASEISDLNQIPSAPLVSVIMITYNHEAYIEQAIEGILAQQGDFPIELIIGEDKSKDRTIEICLDYQKTYPHLIRVVTWHENVGANANFLRVWGRTRGKYVALCEGDDYWIDPAKLTKQVALMEEFPDTSFCGARTRVLNEIPGNIFTNAVIGPERSSIKYSLKDVWTTYLCHTSTFMFRKSKLRFSEHIRSLVCLDRYLQSLSAIHGSLRCLPDVVSVYRIHPGGIYMGSTLYLQYYHTVAVCEALLDIVDAPEARYVKIGLDLAQYKRCHELIDDGRMSEARQMAHGFFRRLAGHNLLRALLLFFHISLPKPYAFMQQLGENVGINRYVRRFLSNLDYPARKDGN
jgi:glycosyltransferase involved in cell wall biosynthesis